MLTYYGSLMLFFFKGRFDHSEPFHFTHLFLVPSSRLILALEHRDGTQP